MAQFVHYGGMGGTPVYFQPTIFASEPSYSPIYGYGQWQKISYGGGPSKEVKVPERSMIAEWLANKQPYTQFATQQAPLSALGYNPSMANLYSPAISSLYSTGSSLLAPSTSGTSYGAGRYLGNTGLLGGLNFGLPSGQSANTSGTP